LQIDGSSQGSESPTERNDPRSWTWNKRTGRIRGTVFFAPNPVTTNDWHNVGRITIDILPDEVLLEIFDFLVESYKFEAENWWRTLVHVCRKWRNVIFESPHRLNLRLVCSDGTPVRAMLDIWPPFPIVIRHSAPPKSGWDNIVAALERNDRVCQITMQLDLQWEKVLDAMQEPFTALTHLILSSNIELAPVVPNSFMGGSAPRLQHLLLQRLPFPGLPKLLLSTTDLVRLTLWDIPHSGYISPQAIVVCLSALPRLEWFYLGFESPRSRPNRETRRLPPSIRSVLPTLNTLYFTGVSEYLEDLVARIDSPLLNCLEISLFPQLIFDTPQLLQFISRTPTLELHDRARVDFSHLNAGLRFPNSFSGNHFGFRIRFRQPEWQLSCMAQIFTSFFPRSLIHMVERLYILDGPNSKLEWLDDIENRQWLELLHPFTGVKNLYLSQEFVPRIAPYLQELDGGRTTEVLPALQTLYLEDIHPSGAVGEAIEKFVATRQLSNIPVAVSYWDRKND
jgi:hypothetical protein